MKKNLKNSLKKTFKAALSDSDSSSESAGEALGGFKGIIPAMGKARSFFARGSSKKGDAAGDASKNGEIVLHRFPAYFLLGCLLFFGLFLVEIFRPFITVLILAAILATAFYPLYEWVLKKVGGRARVASLTTCLLVLFLIIVPLFLFAFLLARQTMNVYFYVQQSVVSGALDPYLRWESGGVLYDALGNIRHQLDGVVDFDSIDLKGAVLSAAGDTAQFLAAQTANALKGFGKVVIGLFILFFSMYYFFKDAHAIIRKLMVLSPLPNKHEEALFYKFKEMSLATLYGIFLTSVVQGIVGGIGMALAGIPNALFWGTAIAIFSLVPVVGTSVVWLPASVLLLLSGHIVAGVFLFLWGMMIVGTIDNFLRAFLIGGRTKMNQLLMFLAVFGGILAFGLPGVVFGPLILALFFAFLHIYETEYDRVLHHGD